MRRSPRGVGALASVLVAFAPLVLAHEDDPKIYDRLPAYRGPGYRGVQLRGGGASLASVAPPVDFASSGVTLMSWMTLGEFGAQHVTGNDCWGHVSGSGREYALMGLSHGLGVVEVTNPSDPRLLEVIDGPPSLWRDVKVYDDHAYVVSEGGGGVQVVDLSGVDQGIVTLVNTVTDGGATTATHNVAIDPEGARLYRCGGLDHGLRIYDLGTPAAPAYLGDWSTRYVHDAQVVVWDEGPFAGRHIAFACSGYNGGSTDTGLDVLDVTDPTDVVVLDRVSWPSAAYSHQCWLSEDRRYVYVNDELDEPNFGIPSTTRVFRLDDLTDLVSEGGFDNGVPAIGHNFYVRDQKLYAANYTSGLRVFDLAADATDPPEIAWFDTYVIDDSVRFNSLWSVYPYFPSGTVIGSDIEKGLFVWHEGQAELAFDYPDGLPELLDPAGQSFLVDITAGAGAALDAQSPRLHYDWGAGVVSQPLVALGNDRYRVDLPPAPCGVEVGYYLTATTASGAVWKDPVGHDGLGYVVASADARNVLASFDMEADDGWVPGGPQDDATTGVWTRVDPFGTSAEPADDHTPLGTDCWVTGGGFPFAGLGDDDVDDGTTSLRSPALDLSGATDPHISYWRWFSNATSGEKLADVLEVHVRAADGDPWTPVETVGPTGHEVVGGWIRHQFRVRDFVTPSSEVRVRFRASDLGEGSIVEAAIDDFEVWDLVCPDCNGNGVPDGIDVVSGSSLDLDGELTPDECQPLSANTPDVSVGGGGTQVWTLDAGLEHAGGVFLILGSVTGTSPGLPIDDTEIPLVFDVYTLYTMNSPNATPLEGTFGLLGVLGSAVAQFRLPPGSNPNLVGVELHHAFVVLDAADAEVLFASNAIPVRLVP